MCTKVQFQKFLLVHRPETLPTAACTLMIIPVTLIIRGEEKIIHRFQSRETIMPACVPFAHPRRFKVAQHFHRENRSTNDQQLLHELRK